MRTRYIRDTCDDGLEVVANPHGLPLVQLRAVVQGSDDSITIELDTDGAAELHQALSEFLEEFDAS